MEINTQAAKRSEAPFASRWKDRFLRAYQALICRPFFYPLNRRLFLLSLRGIGVLNTGSAVALSERRLIRAVFRRDPAAVIFDVGAHVGEYSSEVLSAHPAAEVHAFEPHPASFRALERLRECHGNFHPVNAALGSDAGQASFYDYDDGSGSAHASFYREVIENIHHGAAQEISVPRLTLDEYCAQRSIASVSLLKIDTEGSELEVLRGARRLLADGAIAAIQFEFNEMNIISRSFLHDFLEILEGYDLYRSLPGGFVPFDYLTVFEIFGYQNFVAVRRGTAGLI